MKHAMTVDDAIPLNLQDATAEKRAALTYVVEAFVEAQLDGLDGDCMAHAALFAAFQELVATYGEGQRRATPRACRRKSAPAASRRARGTDRRKRDLCDR